METHEEIFPQKAVEQSRNVIENVNREVESATNALEKYFDKTGKGLTGFQLQLLDIMQTNIMAAFDFTRKIMAAKSFPEAIELQSAYIKGQMVAASAQTETLRDAWSGAFSGALEPMKQNAITSLQRGRIC